MPKPVKPAKESKKPSTSTKPDSSTFAGVRGDAVRRFMRQAGRRR